MSIAGLSSTRGLSWWSDGARDADSRGWRARRRRSLRRSRGRPAVSCVKRMVHSRVGVMTVATTVPANWIPRAWGSELYSHARGAITCYPYAFLYFRSTSSAAVSREAKAAWQLAERGHDVVPSRDARCVRGTPAHKTDRLAELVCSNTFKSTETSNAHGLLKAEMRVLRSMILQAADEARVPGGSALTVDRDVFSAAVHDRVVVASAHHCGA